MVLLCFMDARRGNLGLLFASRDQRPYTRSDGCAFVCLFGCLLHLFVKPLLFVSLMLDGRSGYYSSRLPLRSAGNIPLAAGDMKDRAGAAAGPGGGAGAGGGARGGGAGPGA